MATGGRTLVAAMTLAVAVLVAASPAWAINVGGTCPCALSEGRGQCIHFESGTATSGTCTIAKCGSSFMCVPDAAATHECLAQAGSGTRATCDGAVTPGQKGCPCTTGPVTGTKTTLVPMQTVPRGTPTMTPAPVPTGCKTNDECGANEVCVSGTCEAAGECTPGKKKICDDVYPFFSDDNNVNNQRAKCCPASSQCVKSGVQAGQSTACSTSCGKICEPFCSLSDIDGVPLCSSP